MGEYGTLNEFINLGLFKHKVDIVFSVGNDMHVAICYKKNLIYKV